jgi:hypothetical protein
MIYLMKDLHNGTSVVHREVSSENDQRLRLTRSSKETISRIRQTEEHSKSSADGWTRSWQNDRSQSNVQRDRVRLSGNQWF